MAKKRFIQSLHGRIKRATDGGNALFFNLLQRPKRQNFTTAHDKLLRGGVPIKKRVKRLFLKWKSPSSPKYSLVSKSRFTKARIAVFLTVISLCLVLFGFRGEIYKQVLKYDVFQLASVKVTGCLKTNPDEITQFLQVKYNSRLLAINPSDLEKRLEGHPWIYKAEVTRRLPDTLIIALQEYMPKAIMMLGGKQDLYYVDQEGYPFIQLEVGQDMDFPVITGLEKFRAMPGLKQQLLDIIEFLEQTDRDDPNLPIQSVSQLHVDPKEGTILFLVDFPFPIFLGKENIQNKYNRLKKVVGFLYKERKKGMNINEIAYIRMDYLDKKVLVAHTAQVGQR